MSDTPTLPFKPPHSPEAEQSVLGALLLDNTAIDQLGELREFHFFDALHRRLFAAATAQIMAGHPCDVLTVYDAVRDTAGDEVLAYLNACTASVPSMRSVRRYAQIICDRYADRKLAGIGLDIQEAARDSTTTVEAKIDAAQEALTSIVARQSRQGPQDIASGMAAQIALIERRSEGKDTFTPTGLIDLDNMLDGGTRGGQVIVIGARPSMGKTTLALSIVRHQARIEPRPGDVPTWALVLSQEMPLAQLNDAHIAALGHIALSKVRRPDPNDSDTWTRILEGVERAAALRMLQDDQSALRLLDVRSKILAAKRHAKQQGGRLATVVIDFLQLMAGEGDNRNAQLDAISNGIKSMAINLDVCIILLSQCNRDAEKKPDGADSMSDLRDSGAIEAAGDIVALLHREYVRTEDPNLRNFASLRLAKNRFGAIGRVSLYFDGPFQYFGNYAGPPPVTGVGVGARSRRTHQERD